MHKNRDRQFTHKNIVSQFTHNNRISQFTHNNSVSKFLYKDSVRKVRICLVVLLFSVFFINHGSFKVLAASTLVVSPTVDNNKVTFKISDSTNLSDNISILVMQKSTGSIVFMDQGKLNNGEYTFSTVLPKGDYTGYVSSSSTDNVPIQDFTVVNDEKIVGFRRIAPINVEIGSEVVLPSTVIAIFDDGANRIVAVNWSATPDTTKAGRQTILGSIDGYDVKVSIIVNVGKLSNDATLNSITVGGIALSSFEAYTTEYNVVLPAGTTVVPEVVGIVTVTGKATAVVNSATSLPGATTIVVTAEDGTTAKIYTINFIVSVNVLQSITIPDAITGIANGTAKTAEALGLPTKVNLVTESGEVSAKVTWEVENLAYDVSKTISQSFTVTGTVTLPEDVVNTNNIEMKTTIQVTVLAMDGYIITFDSQGGSEVEGQVVKPGNTIKALQEPTKAGYSFVGWYEEAACRHEWNFDKDKVNANTTLYAKWKISGYTVTFDTQGGSKVPSKKVDYKETIKKPSAPKRTGYTFDGWYKDAECTIEWNFETDKVTGNIILYAKWTADKTFTVSYNKNGGNGNVPVDISKYAVGDTVTLLDNTESMIRKGYTFAGWNTEANGKGTTYEAGEEVIIGTSNMTLYAIWVKSSK